MDENREFICNEFALQEVLEDILQTEQVTMR